MNYTLNGLLFVLLGCLCGCDSSVVAEDQVIVESSLKRDIYPLETGNSWSYLFTAHENETLEHVDTILVEIVGTEIIEFEGRKLEVFIEHTVVLNSDSQPISQLLRFEEEGLYRYFRESQESSATNRLLVKYPAVVGDSWTISYGDYADELKYESTEATITTPTGIFDAYQVRIGDGGSWRIDRYYSPGVGFVGSESESVIDSRKHVHRKVLLEYLIN